MQNTSSLEVRQYLRMLSHSLSIQFYTYDISLSLHFHSLLLAPSSFPEPSTLPPPLIGFFLWFVCWCRGETFFVMRFINPVQLLCNRFKFASRLSFMQPFHLTHWSSSGFPHQAVWLESNTFPTPSAYRIYLGDTARLTSTIDVGIPTSGGDVFPSHTAAFSIVHSILMNPDSVHSRRSQKNWAIAFT